MSGLMSLAEVSRYLGMSERTIYGWAQEGKIPAFKLGSAWRFRRSEVDEWLEGHRSGGGSKVPITPDVDLEPTRWRVREMDEEERAALVKSCKNAINDMLTWGVGQCSWSLISTRILGRTRCGRLWSC